MEQVEGDVAQVARWSYPPEPQRAPEGSLAALVVQGKDPEVKEEETNLRD